MCHLCVVDRLTALILDYFASYRASLPSKSNYSNWATTIGIAHALVVDILTVELH